MGVPAYFRWLIARYESTIIVKKLPTRNAKYLLLDFNGAIHPAVRKDPVMTRDKMPGAVITYLETILKWVNPDKVFIAIDGVAPRAKMEQQRERRYKSVMDARFYRDLNKKYGKQETSTVDFNMISPGTEFMDELHKVIESWISNQPDPVKYKLCGADVPGEGEHKIMKEIRNAASSGVTYCVYGLDADLIFLSALTNPDIYLVREATQFDSKNSDAGFRLLSIRVLWNKLVEILSSKTSLEAIEAEGITNRLIAKSYQVPACKMENNPESRMLDYTVLCFLVGNDFLPNLPSIRIREESLSDLIVAYKAISWELDAYLVTQTGHINREFLQRLFDYIAETEDTVLVEQTQNRHARIAKQQYRKKRLSAYELEKDTYENVESQWVDQIEAGTPGWRNRYYQYHIGCITMIRPMVENYIAGLEWVLNYYTGHSNQNWSWYYKYPVAPTAADLADLLRFVPEIRHTPSPPVSPVVQLMHILPPDSAALIRDERMRRLMTEKSSPIIWYYPTSFKIDMQGARYRHEAKCILPKGDLSVLNNSNII